MRTILSVYNLPGRLLAELWYLWPKKGQIWASGRRRSHPLPHFIYSSLIYITLLFFVFGAAQTSGEDFEIAQASSTEFEQETQSEELVDASMSETIMALDNPAALPRPEVDHVTINSSTEQTQSDVMDIHDLNDEFQQAFETGETIRWERGEEKGYIVPSEIEESSGCRNIFFTMDSRNDWQSATIKHCR